MVDSSRHFLPLAVIRRTLDSLPYAKLNVLHWHVVDSQAFPFVSEHIPSMSATGAYTPDHVYTVADVKEIVAYAGERGIRVIPEFDTPGHVSRGWESLGVLTDCFDDETGRFSHTGPLNPTLDKTFETLTTLWADVLAAFAPEKFVHIGGDEVWHTPTHSCWQSNPQVQAWLKQHPEVDGFSGLETLFERRVLDMLHAAGASVAIWQEIFDNGAMVPSDTVIDVWKGGWPGAAPEMAKVTAAGFHAVLSAPYYLNHIAYGADWWQYYQVEPANFTGGAAAEASKVLAGIKACFWSEWIDGTNLVSRAWPRAAGVAERAWSSKDVTNGMDAEHRIDALRCKLIARGLNAEPIGGCNNVGCNTNDTRLYFPGAAGHCAQEWVPAYSGVGAA